MSLSTTSLLVLFLCTVRVSAFVPSGARTPPIQIPDYVQLFNKFIEVNKKQYSSGDEYNFRFNVFKNQLDRLLETSKPLAEQVTIESSSESASNTKVIIVRGSNPCAFVRNLNQFADMTDEEFNRFYLLTPEFFQNKTSGRQSVLNFSHSTEESAELKLRLADETYDIFADALLSHQNAQRGHKIQPRASEGGSEYNQLLMSLLSPKSQIFNNAKAPAEPLTESCIAYMYRSKSKSSNTITTPFGSITKKSSSSTSLNYAQLRSVEPSSIGVFPRPGRKLQSYGGRYSNFYDSYNSYDDYFTPRYSSLSSSRNSRNTSSNKRTSKVSSQEAQTPKTTFTSKTDPFTQTSDAGHSNTRSPASTGSPNVSVPSSSSRANMATVGGVDVPAFLDWRDAGIITPVKDQKRCKGCYAFAGIGTLEANRALQNGNVVRFSEQEILDCSFENQGCEGGLPSYVFEYVRDSGICTEASYPYKSLSARDTCDRSSSQVRYKFVNGFVYIKSGVIPMINALQFGPISALMYASNDFKLYKKGVYRGEGCAGISIPNHAITIVGYDLKAAIPYFIIKNAWGENWGDDGYFKMEIGELKPSNEGLCLLGSTGFNAFPVVGKDQ